MGGAPGGRGRVEAEDSADSVGCERDGEAEPRGRWRDEAEDSAASVGCERDGEAEPRGRWSDEEDAEESVGCERDGEAEPGTDARPSEEEESPGAIVGCERETLRLCDEDASAGARVE